MKTDDELTVAAVRALLVKWQKERAELRPKAEADNEGYNTGWYETLDDCCCELAAALNPTDR